LDSAPLNITSFGKALHLNGQRLYVWYRDVLSHYSENKGRCIHENDIKIKKNGKEETIEVPVFREDNFGANMAIDEKQIGRDFYTIMSNRESGKLAMVSQTMKYEELELIFNAHPTMSGKVKTLTRDFSKLYKKVGNEIFRESIQIGDKFHAIKNLMDAHQSIRIRYRQKELERKRISFNEFKGKEQKRKQECNQAKIEYKKKKFYYEEEKHRNGETSLELLARSRYLLYKYESQWSESQKKRAKILFRLYPEIEKAYQLSCEFRDFMSRDNIGKNYLLLNKRLYKWFEKVEESQISEMLNFQSMVEINEEYIMNYFIDGATNALAEGLNSKIQKFISSNNGTRDKDFFFFRLANYYA